MRSIERAWGLRASDRPIGSVFTRHVRLVVPATSTRPASSFVSHGADVGKECYLVDPAAYIKVVAVKKLVVGPWVGSTGPPPVCTGRLVPSTGDTLLALIGRVVPPVLLL
ncbi:unnamed protein product [Prunus brigantina]